MIRTRTEALLGGLVLRLMFQDEARYGRINDPRQCWAYKGIRPVTHKQIIREYTYLYGAFCPGDGGMDCLILPSMDSACMNLFLKEVSARHPGELVLMVTDGAPCHKGQELTVPDNMRLLFLPPYCPQLNPAENMRDEMREKFFGNVSFESMDQLEDHLVAASIHYENAPATVKSISDWEWMGLY